jgi:uncharacterized membrane protein YccF (DUF307 family)
MAEHPIQGLMGVTIEKIRDMVNAETIIGDPIHVDDTTIIPVSRVTFGFVSGGSDVGPSSNKQMFGGTLVPLESVWYYIVGGFVLLGFVLCGLGTATSIRKHLNV